MVLAMKSSHGHTSTRSLTSSNVNHRNAKCRPQSCALLPRDLSSLNLLENGTTNWIIFIRHEILEYYFSDLGNYNSGNLNTDFKSQWNLLAGYSSCHALSLGGLVICPNWLAGTASGQTAHALKGWPALRQVLKNRSFLRNRLLMALMWPSWKCQKY